MSNSDDHRMSRKDFLKSSMIGAGGLALTGLSAHSVLGNNGDTQPNILLLFADDMTYHDLGNPQIETPYLNHLASQGMRFGRAFNSAPMCAPTRMSLYTGIHPVRNGAWPNHSKIYPGIKTWPQYLQDLGYRTALIGKQHEAPKDQFPFEVLGGRHHDNGKGVDMNLNKIRTFMEDNRSDPWSLIVSSNQPHGPWNRGIPYKYKPGEIDLPPYLVDTPETRKAMARYYAEITYMDEQMGTVLQHLKETGQEDNTIVIFLSEQGSHLPHCKWTCYDTGVRSTAIMRWPDVIDSGRESGALIEYVDVLPTLLDAIGASSQDQDFDGNTFLPLLKGEQSKHNDYTFSIQTSKGIYNGPEAYGIRTVRSDNYRLIWNVNHDNKFQNLVTGGYGPFKSWERKAKSGDPFAQKRVSWYKKRPEFELYDNRKDPFELHNVADDPAYREVREKLKEELDRWMTQQGDKGAETERRALERQSDRWMG